MSAKEMFEKLGYEYVRETSYRFLYRKRNYGDTQVTFWEDTKEYVIESKYRISFVEIQAINKQVEELGWNNVKD